MKVARLLILAGIIFGAHAARAAEILYGITFSDELISISTSNGAGTLIGTIPGPPAPTTAIGLAVNGGNLYIFDSNANVLRQIDTATAAVLNTTDPGFNSLFPGIAISEGDITFRGNGTGYLYSNLDSTGSFGSGSLYTFTTSASSGALAADSLADFMDGLAFSALDVLYGLSQTGDRLVTINPATGAVTPIGSGTGITTIDSGTGFPLYGFGALAFSSNGTLYGVLSNFETGVGSLSKLYSFNTTTGVGTFIGDIGIPQVTGLAFVTTASPAPEPATLFLAGGAAIVLAAFLRRRRR